MEPDLNLGYDSDSTFCSCKLRYETLLFDHLDYPFGECTHRSVHMPCRNSGNQGRFSLPKLADPITQPFSLNENIVILKMESTRTAPVGEKLHSTFEQIPFEPEVDIIHQNLPTLNFDEEL